MKPTDKLYDILNSLPLTEPSRVVESEDGSTVLAEWFFSHEGYMELEVSDTEMSFMTKFGDKVRHFTLSES